MVLPLSFCHGSLRSKNFSDKIIFATFLDLSSSHAVKVISELRFPNVYDFLSCQLLDEMLSGLDRF